jgi:hypothetical protein
MTNYKKTNSSLYFYKLNNFNSKRLIKFEVSHQFINIINHILFLKLFIKINLKEIQSIIKIDKKFLTIMNSNN